jgi:Coenzyme PQQ synthesis protein D (PqqD).
MNKFIESYVPRARQEDLVIEGLGDETLVYDMRSHKAHCLNRTAALVWNRCDGKATVSEMRATLEKEFHTPVNSNVVWLALEQLGKAKLLSDRLPGSVSQQAISRRAVIRKIGLGAAVALPLVTSILAPTTAEAATCTATGGACISFDTCCSHCCNGSQCIPC